MWAKRKDFETVVKQAWRSNFTGNHMYNLAKKTMVLKKNIKKWNITTFGNIFKQLKEVENELSKIQQIILKTQIPN